MANGKRLEFLIGGMHCAACSARIERVVGGMQGVKSAVVSLGSAQATIILEDEVQDVEALRAEIIQTIARLGFSAEPLESAAEDLNSAGELWEENNRRRQAELAARRRELVLAFVFAIPLVTLSMGEMLGLPLPAILSPHAHPLNFALAQLVLCLPVLFVGRRFYFSGLPALFRRVPNMDSLVAMGTGAAFLYSLWGTIEIFLALHGGTGALAPEAAHALAMHRAMDLYYESAAMLIALISLGKFLELRSSARTSEAIKLLLDLAPAEATMLLDSTPEGEKKLVPVAELRVGDHVLVRPGERVATDGVVAEGASMVDESMLSGESLAVEKGVGSPLVGGSINLQGMLVLRVEKVGADTALARIVRLVREAQGSKAPIAALADKVSLYFVPVVMVIALFAALGWLVSGAEFAFAVRIFVTVMVIACPCAMGLATPTSIMVGTGRGAQLGCLIKSGTALEAAARLDVMLLDKTGTLTQGSPKLTDILPLSSGAGRDKKDFLRFAASLESISEHPLARAILEAAAEEGLALRATTSFENLAGKGLKGTVLTGEGPMEASLGSFELARQELAGQSLAILHELEEAVNGFTAQGKTTLTLTVRGKPVAVFAVADALRPESAAVLAELKKQGLRLIMLSGDNLNTANAIARGLPGSPPLPLDEVLAGLLPGDKERKVVELQQQGLCVGMIGDGINDAPALARADVGFVMNNGIDISAEAGDIVLMRSGLAPLLTALKLSRATLRNIRQNLFWAFAYNALGIPVAAGVLHIWGGPTLSPMLAGAAMALSSVSVVSNALRLRFWKPE